MKIINLKITFVALRKEDEPLFLYEIDKFIDLAYVTFREAADDFDVKIGKPILC